jgi:hypothetical protein
MDVRGAWSCLIVGFRFILAAGWAAAAFGGSDCRFCQPLRLPSTTGLPVVSGHLFQCQDRCSELVSFFLQLPKNLCKVHRCSIASEDERIYTSPPSAGLHNNSQK